MCMKGSFVKRKLLADKCGSLKKDIYITQNVPVMLIKLPISMIESMNSQI